RPLGHNLGLAAELFAFPRHFLQFTRIVGAEHDIGAGAGEHLRRERAEGAGGAGHDRGLAADVEQGERIFQKVLGHGGGVLACDLCCLYRHHCCGVDTATSMVTTSLPRLTISRRSFGPMKQESLALSTVSLPPAISVSSPVST